MSVTRIATRYAKSLLDLAIERGQLEPVNEDMRELSRAVRNRDLLLLLKSPVVHADKKIAVLEAVFQGRIQPLTLAYMKLLTQKGREGYIPEITAEFVHQYKTLKHITTVRVTSAAPLSEAVLEDLRRHLVTSGATTEHLDIETRIDPKLVGGFVLEFDNKRYDASVAHKLEELKAQFTKNLYVKEF